MIDWLFKVEKFTIKFVNDYMIIYTILKVHKVEWRIPTISFLVNVYDFILDCTFVVAQTF